MKAFLFPLLLFIPYAFNLPIPSPTLPVILHRVWLHFKCGNERGIPIYSVFSCVWFAFSATGFHSTSPLFFFFNCTAFSFISVVEKRLYSMENYVIDLLALAFCSAAPSCCCQVDLLLPICCNFIFFPFLHDASKKKQRG